jgi:hypothetical protein
MIVLSCLGQLLVGCSAWDEDTPDRVEFALPTLKFYLPSSPLPTLPPEGIPNMVCFGPTALSTDCCNPPEPFYPVDCQQHPLACNPSDNFCAMIFDRIESTSVDLSEIPEIVAAHGRVFSSVSLVSLTAEVSVHNPLIRSADLYIGPANAQSPLSPDVSWLAAVSLARDNQVLVPDLAGQQAFSVFAKDYLSQFHFFLEGHFVITNKPSDPKGSVTIDVTMKGKAVGYY